MYWIYETSDLKHPVCMIEARDIRDALYMFHSSWCVSQTGYIHTDCYGNLSLVKGHCEYIAIRKFMNAEEA